jgi:succinate dehydrogenase / fumarate reductase cytochrome b subunit
MNALATLVRSTIGQKVVMAVTGLIMVGWLTMHMAGNFLVFLGEEEFNSYAEWIQSGFGASPEFLWGMRLFMLLVIVAHVRAAVMLSARNRAARPGRYAVALKPQRTTYAARFMLLGGITIMLFLLFHLAHLTLGVMPVDPMSGAEFIRGNAYHNVVYGLGNPLLAGIYILANLALGAHLWHGVTSGFQTLGVHHPRYNGLKNALGVLLPVLICGGNILIAIGVAVGLPSV